MKTVNLGCDLRRNIVLQKTWSQEQTCGLLPHLVNAESGLVLTVDPAIWPPVPRGEDFTHGDWPQLITIEDAFALQRLLPEPGAEVLMLSVARSNYRQAYRWWQGMIISQDIDDAQSEMIGFDVVDQYFTSALCNCGLGAEFRARPLPALQKSFRRDNSLLSEYESAEALASWCNENLNDHAPFSVILLSILSMPGVPEKPSAGCP